MERREALKGIAVLGASAAVWRCSQDLTSPPPGPRELLLSASLTKANYKKWLRGFRPGDVVGRRGSELDCPTARFAAFEAKRPAIVLVQQHAFNGGPITANPAWLATHVKKLDASGPDGSSITRREAQRLL